MPSSNKSLSKLSRYFLLPVLLLLTGCLAVEESQMYLDVPTHSNYLPPVIRPSARIPNKILLLPITGQVDDEAIALFEAEFVSALQTKEPTWKVSRYEEGGQSGTVFLNMSENQAQARARLMGDDTILAVVLSGERIYSPLRLVADIEMTDVATGETIFKMHADYDAAQAAVAASARRYFQQRLNNQHMPDRSLSILDDLGEYLRFTGYYSAKLLTNAYAPKPNQVEKAKPVTPGDSAAPYSDK